MHSGASAKQLKTHIVEADGVALFLSRWTLKAANSNPDDDVRTFVATTVLRKQPDGTWKALIDNSFGPLVLGPQ
jgi:ketosteroid isomerase-like protein